MKEVSKIIVGFLVFIILGAGIYLTETRRMSDEPLVIPAPGWISKKELKRIQKYHGTIALKITDNTVYIWRDKKWIQVLVDAE